MCVGLQPGDLGQGAIIEGWFRAPLRYHSSRCVVRWLLPAKGRARSSCGYRVVTPAARGRVAGEEPMVLTRPQHHNRRGMPAGITFGHGGCQLACCTPGSRQELATRRIPLPYECRVAFLMGCSRAVPRLAEDCAPSLRRMPLEVVRRIIELCTRCATHTQHTTRPVCSP